METLREWCASPGHQSALDPERLMAWGAVNYLNTKAPKLSAKSRMTAPQRTIILALGLVIILCALVRPIPTLVAVNAIFIFHCLTVFGLRVYLLYLSATDARPREDAEPTLAEKDLPTITILCPMYDEADSLPGLVETLRCLDYPTSRLDIRLVLEEQDDATIAAAMAIDLPSNARIIKVPKGLPQTKPKACNYALWQAKGELLVVYDAEDRPEADQLKKAAQAFCDAPEDVCCFQAKLSYYNRDETFLTRMFAIEYALLFDLILPGLDRIGAPLPLGGTSNFFRTRQLVDLGGWDPYNVTEDADLGMRMASAGLKSRVLDSTTYEEATARLGPWLRQRSRWIKGYMQTWLVHCRHTGTRRDARVFLTLHLLIAAVVIAALLNPFYWLLYGSWLAGADWVEPLFPPPLDALATFTLLAGNLFHIWMFMLAPMRRRWHDLVPYALLAPVYWLLQSAAGFIALKQLITAPSFWEKTEHGPGKTLKEAALAAVPDGP
ncbi:MAG: glycosyltransferase family 2 protein [Parvularcula sp.]